MDLALRYKMALSQLQNHNRHATYYNPSRPVGVRWIARRLLLDDHNIIWYFQNTRFPCATLQRWRRRSNGRVFRSRLLDVDREAWVVRLLQFLLQFLHPTRAQFIIRNGSHNGRNAVSTAVRDVSSAAARFGGGRTGRRPRHFFYPLPVTKKTRPSSAAPPITPTRLRLAHAECMHSDASQPLLSCDVW